MNAAGMEPSGLLIVKKEAGCTSHDVVNRVRRLFGTRRVGHAGTLDPMATGVLVVLVGRAAKASEYAVGGKKRYRAVMRLGLTTDTEDITGQILSETVPEVSAARVEEVCRSFVGELMQVPPMYSALKRGGQKLCDIARAGGNVEREARPITVTSLAVSHLTDRDYSLDVECSAGTYIRTLCADIGAALGCGAVMAALERTCAVGFPIGIAHTLAEIEALSPEDRLSLLLPVEGLFSELEEIRLSAFYERLFRSGCGIYLKKIGHSPLPVGTRLRVSTADGSFFALGEVTEAEEGLAVRSVKLFVL